MALTVVGGGSLWAGASAGTLGFDFLAYHQAAGRVLAGQPLYDVSTQVTGGSGFFYYPPPFVLAILPLAALGPGAAMWLWAGLSVAALVGGIGLMPVSRNARWVTLLLAALSWPVAYALKLGQVGPLLLLLFVIGWRDLASPVAVGGSAALGAIVKLQPGLILVWAAITQRWRAVAIGIVVLAALAAAATLVTGGPHVWTDYLAVLQNVSDPISTPHNFTPGAVAYQAGLSASLAAVIQLISSVGAVGVLVVAAFRCTPAASYLVAVTASQLLSPVLWDHYAMLLLVPVAWLLERRQWWAALIPLASSVFVIGLTPPAIYPIAFWLTLVAVAVAGVERQPVRTPEPMAAA